MFSKGSPQQSRKTKGEPMLGCQCSQGEWFLRKSFVTILCALVCTAEWSLTILTGSFLDENKSYPQPQKSMQAIGPHYAQSQACRHSVDTESSATTILLYKYSLCLLLLLYEYGARKAPKWNTAWQSQPSKVTG